MKYRKCYLFFGSDAHGTASGVISFEQMEKECREVFAFSKFPDTADPKKFWKETYKLALEELKDAKGECHIVITDIPFDVAEPEKAIEAIREMLDFCDVTVVDHHRTTAKHMDKAIELGARIIITPSARTTFYLAEDGKLSEDQLFIARIGAISDRDSSVLPITEEEAILAYGLDALVRPPYNPMKAFEVLRNRDWDKVREEGIKLVEKLKKYTEPINVRLYDKYLVIKEAPVFLRYKILDYATMKYNKPYGISYSEDVHRVTGEPISIITVITNWRSGAVAIGKKIDIEKLKEKYDAQVVGHPEAISIIVKRDLGKEVFEEILKSPALKTEGWT